MAHKRPAKELDRKAFVKRPSTANAQKCAGDDCTASTCIFCTCKTGIKGLGPLVEYIPRDVLRLKVNPNGFIPSILQRPFIGSHCFDCRKPFHGEHYYSGQVAPEWYQGTRMVLPTTEGRDWGAEDKPARSKPKHPKAPTVAKVEKADKAESVKTPKRTSVSAAEGSSRDIVWQHMCQEGAPPEGGSCMSDSCLTNKKGLPPGAKLVPTCDFDLFPKNLHRSLSNSKFLETQEMLLEKFREAQKATAEAATLPTIDPRAPDPWGSSDSSEDEEPSPDPPHNEVDGNPTTAPTDQPIDSQIFEAQPSSDPVGAAAGARATPDIQVLEPGPSAALLQRDLSRHEDDNKETPSIWNHGERNNSHLDCFVNNLRSPYFHPNVKLATLARMYPGNTDILLQCMKQNERQNLANELRKANSSGIKVAHDELNWKAFTLSCVQEGYNKLKFFSSVFLQNCFDEAVFEGQMKLKALEGIATLRCMRFGDQPFSALFNDMQHILKVPKENILIYRCLAALEDSQDFERQDPYLKGHLALRKETIPVRDLRVLNSVEQQIRVTFKEHTHKKFTKLEIKLILLFLYGFAVQEVSRIAQWRYFKQTAQQARADDPLLSLKRLIKRKYPACPLYLLDFLPNLPAITFPSSSSEEEDQKVPYNECVTQ